MRNIAIITLLIVGIFVIGTVIGKRMQSEDVPAPEATAPSEAVSDSVPPIPAPPVVSDSVLEPEVLPVEVAVIAPAIIAPLENPKPKPRPYISPTKFSDGFAKFLRFTPEMRMVDAERKIRARMAPLEGVETHSFTYETNFNGRDYVVTATGENYRDPKLKGERLVLVFNGETAQNARMISYGAQFKCYTHTNPNAWQIRPCR